MYAILKKCRKDYYDTLDRLAFEARRNFSGQRKFSPDFSLTDEQKQQVYDYWHKYTKDFDIAFHTNYTEKSGVFDVRYIPHDIYAGYINPYFNARQICEAICDKNCFDMYYRGIRMPETYLRLINGEYLDKDYTIVPVEDAARILADKQKFIAKPSINSFGGKSVKIFTDTKYDEIKQYLTKLKDDGADRIFQELIKQHSATAILHPQSLNTLRVTTLLHNGEVKILCTILRMGIGGSIVDNASAGGIFCKVFPDGTLGSIAFDLKKNAYTRHPSGGEFSQCKITCMNRVFELVKTAAPRLPHIRMIGFDIAVNEKNEPVLIEANLTVPSLWQEVCGPLFGEDTDAVLDEVFFHPRKKCSYMDYDLWLNP
jgi:hypothetical protein